MFRKVLIANRGEIACRIIRTCQRLGVGTVAVYSEADARAPHVGMADEAYRIGPAPARESYLRLDAILQAARESGAEAIHPGFGFLSENAGFARACADAGVVFVGPSPEAIAQMGDKVVARNLARDAGLPLLPGSQDAVSDEDAWSLAHEIGFPVMVKAAAGGGGIGMSVARSAEELSDILKRARSLAQSAFGSSQVFLERFVEKAAHVEIQVLGESQGNVVHLFERDCTTQRRHQKVIEETPSPRITAETLERMTRAAVALAKHIGYTNAGTVEFLVDNQGRFYFLEVNTRLQVEHPVTEMVTGLDLVELQLRVAAGEPLPFSQEEVRRRGHAIEARIYSEDPDNLIPSTGTIQEWREPKGPHIRVDSGVAEGYEVTPFYDPMLAKLVVWGEDREDAISSLDEALQGFGIRGIRTNIPLVRDALEHPEFRDGDYDTGLLERVLQERASRDGHNKEMAAAIAVALAVEMQQRRAAAEAARQRAASAWKLEGRRQQLMSRAFWSTRR